MPTAPTADGMPSTADHDNELLQVTAKHESLQSPPTSPTSPPTRSPTELLTQFGGPGGLGIKLVRATEPGQTTPDETAETAETGPAGPVGAIQAPAALPFDPAHVQLIRSTPMA